MNTRYLPTIFFFYISLILPSFLGAITLNTQSEVDAFDPTITEVDHLILKSEPGDPDAINDLSNLSNITTILGELTVSSTEITTLSELSGLTSVEGFITIQFNAQLLDLQGLSSLTEMNGLAIRGNAALNDLSGLSGLTDIETMLEIRDNPLLVNLEFLSNLNRIGVELEISNNSNLETLAGLSNITSIPTVNIGLNPSLLNLNGLDNMTSISQQLTLSINNSLSDINALSNLTELGELYIDGLAISDINAFFNLTRLNGTLFLKNCPSLENFNGLSNLEHVFGAVILQDLHGLGEVNFFQKLKTVEYKLSITNNQNLAKIEMMPDLDSIGAILEISGNESLSHFDGISNLSHIGGNGVYIANNSSLTSLDGLSGLTILPNGRLHIINNISLPDVNGCAGIMYVGTTLQVSGNTNLTNCCGIQQLLLNPDAVGSSTSISSECLTPSEDCGITVHRIEGKVASDTNGNCTVDSDDVVLKAVTVQAKSGGITYTTQTDENGDYYFHVLPGTYDITTVLTHEYETPCPGEYTAELSGTITFDTAFIDIPYETKTICPYMEVDVAGPVLRECFSNYFHIKYCNKGTIKAEDAYIELTLDEDLSVTDSEIPFSGPTADNVYTFFLGDVEREVCGQFGLDIQLPCDSEFAGEYFGRTFCMDAHIYPDSICNDISSSWDGSSIALESYCEGDSVYFKIQNTGDGDMLNPKTYFVIEDQVMFDQGDFQLPSGNEMILGFRSWGSTYHLAAEQSDEHPGMSAPITSVEACDNFDPDASGAINTFAHDEANPFKSIECVEVTGSYDPNDKRGFPEGYGDMNYIDQNTDIEYMIRFQNTGTDTAFTVVIRDFIQSGLDITTIRPGVSNHDYSFHMVDNRIEFRFDDILLVDSTTNEPGSHGFVKFKISQEKDLPIGTIIENTASIFFDFNAPIITNKTWHTIGEDFITVNLVENVAEINNIKHIKAYPNPFIEYINFELETNNNASPEVELTVYNTMGIMVSSRQFKQSNFKFYKNGLPPGVYFYEIKLGNDTLASGKLVLK